MVFMVKINLNSCLIIGIESQIMSYRYHINSETYICCTTNKWDKANFYIGQWYISNGYTDIENLIANFISVSLNNLLLKTPEPQELMSRLYVLQKLYGWEIVSRQAKIKLATYLLTPTVAALCRREVNFASYLGKRYIIKKTILATPTKWQEIKWLLKYYISFIKNTLYEETQ